jgi:hypothetical protein
LVEPTRFSTFFERDFRWTGQLTLTTF